LLEVRAQKLYGLDIYVSNSTYGNFSQKITMFNRNITVTRDQKLYVTVKATNNTRYGQYDGNIEFKHYVFDPQC
jgi:hypothetical protein